ncbi:asparagine--tRNA ligase [Mariniblastus sp.]|jgi:asparaginyl-tRNA synthetase|nr:asparagine--tRNA ligase [Mariniblastus sp.]MDA7925733.1 asparagine--tRNA ligase [Mariniblastus sp.]MDB4373027.1 asparagine--tRNA ligase [Mariniblastus sp.]MDC0294922.1 asparagine--tRNA ligase [Mariniblastus sp.]
MEKISVKEARDESSIGSTFLLQGWVRTRRDSKAGFSFIEINDGSSQGNIQIIAEAALENYESEVRQLTAGCSISVEGEIKESGGRGQKTEMLAQKICIHGWADPENYPLQKKRHSMEKLREWAHLRPRTNTFGAVARVRNCICNSIHQFYQEQGFLYINTPVITASDCEGAGEMFQVTTMKLEELAKQKIENLNYRFDFFDKPSYLTVSGQLEAETYACALGKVYTFGPTFRAENSNTSRHLAEFWMIEPEVAFADLNDNMDLAEKFLKRIFSDALNKCSEDLEFFNERIDETKSLIERLTTIVDSEFVRLPYTEAVEILQQSGVKFDYAVEWGIDLQSEHERYLTEQHFKKPVILFDYPKTIKPFYMYCNEDDKTVRAMDVLVPGVGEIIGGSQREHRLDILESRMRDQDLDINEYWWYTDLRKYGTVPHAGFGLGLERAVQFVTSMSNIRDVIPFPRTPGNADF